VFELPPEWGTDLQELRRLVRSAQQVRGRCLCPWRLRLPGSAPDDGHVSSLHHADLTDWAVMHRLLSMPGDFHWELRDTFWRAVRGAQEAAEREASEAASGDEGEVEAMAPPVPKSSKLRKALRALATRMLDEQEDAARLREAASSAAGQER
jgi:hypothetical protein